MSDRFSRNLDQKLEEIDLQDQWQLAVPMVLTIQIINNSTMLKKTTETDTWHQGT